MSSQEEIKKASEQFKQEAAQAGISGTAVVDSYPQDGFIRVKLSWHPQERQADLTKAFTETLVTVLGMMGISVKKKINE